MRAFSTIKGVSFLIAVLVSIGFFCHNVQAQSGSWTPTEGPPGGSTPNATYIAPDSTLYVATFGDGIYKSEDDGSTWTEIYDTFDFHGDLLVIGDRILLARASFGDEGFMYSDDGGDTWTEVETEKSAHVLEKGAGLAVAAMDSGYVRVSDDSGSTWSRSHVDMNAGVETVHDVGVLSDQTILAGTDNGLYSMSLEDTVWEQTALDVKASNLVITDNKIYVNKYVSTDNAATWDTLDSYPGGKLIRANDGDLFTTVSLDTIYRSTDDGQNWQGITLEGLARLDMRSVETDHDGNLLLGLWQAGQFRYDKDQQNWQIIGPPTANVLDSYVLKNGNVLAGTERSGLVSYNTSDGNWSNTYSPFANPHGVNLGLIDSAGSRLIMSKAVQQGQATIYFSDDNGKTWAQADSGLTVEGFTDLTATGWAYSDSKGMFIGTREGGVFHSSNGDVWTQINDGLASNQIKDLAIDQEGVIYAATDEFHKWSGTDSSWSQLLQNKESGIETIAVHPNGAVIAGRYLRTSPNSNWEQMTFYEPDESDTLRSVEEIGISPNGSIYLYSHLGTVLRSTDLGESWTEITNGIPEHADINEFEFNGDLVLAATNNSGVYKFEESATALPPESSDLPDNITLQDNYPNPFNPITHISYKLPQTANIELTVYDVLGRRVATLVDGKRKAGLHRITFNAKNLSSGIYIYRLKAGDYSQSRKMLLVK